MEQGQGEGTLERKTMREVIFEGLKWYITPAETATGSDKKKKAKKKDWKRGRTDVEAYARQRFVFDSDFWEPAFHSM